MQPAFPPLPPLSSSRSASPQKRPPVSVQPESPEADLHHSGIVLDQPLPTFELDRPTDLSGYTHDADETSSDGHPPNVSAAPSETETSWCPPARTSPRLPSSEPDEPYGDAAIQWGMPPPELVPPGSDAFPPLPRVSGMSLDIVCCCSFSRRGFCVLSGGRCDAAVDPGSNELDGRKIQGSRFEN